MMKAAFKRSRQISHKNFNARILNKMIVDRLQYTLNNNVIKGIKMLMNIL